MNTLLLGRQGHYRHRLGRGDIGAGQVRGRRGKCHWGGLQPDPAAAGQRVHGGQRLGQETGDESNEGLDKLQVSVIG